MNYRCMLMLIFFIIIGLRAQATNDMSALSRLSDAETRSISPENFSGEKGMGGRAAIQEGTAGDAARDLGQGWKVNPFVWIEPGETFTLAEMDGPGAIEQIWMTPTGPWRHSIMRIYWDGENEPSVEVPVGDFFCAGWNVYKQISSLAVCLNPGSAFNCYWNMPFRTSCKITMENRHFERMRLYYQINYSLHEVPEDAAYFHAQFRRTNPVPHKTVHTILDGVEGQGQYVGTYLAWGSNNNGWWGEGEIKFYMDGDDEYPTICGTGTEDYFCGSYGFQINGEYVDYTTPYAGFHAILPSDDATYRSQTRFGMYRWHITDPVRFQDDLRVTIQALGWRSGGRYLSLRDDVASVAFWYQTEPHAPFPELGSPAELEVN